MKEHAVKRVEYQTLVKLGSPSMMRASSIPNSATKIGIIRRRGILGRKSGADRERGGSSAQNHSPADPQDDPVRRVPGSQGGARMAHSSGWCDYFLTAWQQGHVGAVPHAPGSFLLNLDLLKRLERAAQHGINYLHLGRCCGLL